MGDLASIGTVIIGKVDLLVTGTVTDKGDAAGGDPLVTGEGLDDILTPSSPCDAATNWWAAARGLPA